MLWEEQDPANCQIGRALAVVGQPWTLLVLREVFRGLHRFGKIQRHLGVSPAVLARRLDELVAAGLLSKVPYQEQGSRERHAYELTESGHALYPVLTALREWGERHLPAVDSPTTVYHHRDCGAGIRLALLCTDGHVLAGDADVVSTPAPGARRLADPGRAS